jgi:hypothetical protein
MFLEIAVTLNAEKFSIAFDECIFIPNLRDIWRLSQAFFEELFCKLYFASYIAYITSNFYYHILISNFRI